MGQALVMSIAEKKIKSWINKHKAEVVCGGDRTIGTEDSKLAKRICYAEDAALPPSDLKLRDSALQRIHGAGVFRGLFPNPREWWECVRNWCRYRIAVRGNLLEDDTWVVHKFLLNERAKECIAKQWEVIEKAKKNPRIKAGHANTYFGCRAKKKAKKRGKKLANSPPKNRRDPEKGLGDPERVSRKPQKDSRDPEKWS
ncbi:hypothetical protein QFC20_001014 [Naganishia adeliensis]|uniref:Uncharacterized protein n=1 Tax=Naganishia adeliensis TaxID=92952 RepID=A0ACC2WVN1_9TREE|nr:hypothetical protein QFC20_001014 [Naganishia adeliensis]